MSNFWKKIVFDLKIHKKNVVEYFFFHSQPSYKKRKNEGKE